MGLEALVVERPGSYRVGDLPTPVPEPHEVLVAVEAVGVCGSDLEMVEGTRDPNFCSYPVVLGHEWAGRVVEVGEGVKGLDVGQRVAVEGHNYCGRCRQCKRGETQLCERYEEFGFTLNGGYAQFVAARADLCHPFSGVSGAEAALSEPAACALHGVLRSGVQPGDTVVVVGAGTIGLLAAGLFSLYHPENLVVVDRRRTQRTIALEMGASHYLVAGEDDVPGAVRDLSGGRGADVSFEAAGHPAAVRTAARVAARGGTLVLEGIAGTGRAEPFSFDDLVFSDLRVEGVFAYPSRVFARALELIDRGLLDVGPLITHRLPLAAADRAFELLRRKEEETVKVLLEPSASRSRT